MIQREICVNETVSAVLWRRCPVDEAAARDQYGLGKNTFAMDEYEGL